MASTSEILFGAIVVVNRLASQRRVADALQRARGRPLAELLVEERLLTPEQAQQVHRAQALNQFLRAERIAAQLLVRNRVVDAMSIQRAIAEQEKRQFSVRISEILTEWGMLDQRAAERLADEQLNALAEETARLEEAGLEGAVAELARDTRAASSGVTALADIQSSRMRRARGPRGLLDAQPVRRTAPARPAVDESAFKRTLEVDSARIAAAAAFDDADLIGRTIASRYRILEKVGEGGMGAVYKAEHCLMEKVVAVKILDPDLVSTAETLQRFRREVRAAARFQHRNVIQIYDAGEGEGGLFYMAMEFADGQTLEEIQESEGCFRSSGRCPCSARC